MSEPEDTSLSGVAWPDTVSRAFDRCAPDYDSAAEVVQQMGERLLQRLDYLALEPATVLDLGCGTGSLLPLLRQRYRKAHLLGLDISPMMLQQAGSRRGRWRKAGLIQADAHRLPLLDASVDLVISNMLLPWCHDPERVFTEAHRVLRAGGALMFTSAGPDTLQEYLALWPDAADRHFGLLDMHAVGDALVAARFSDPVLDRENVRIDYPSIERCENELRAIGAVNLSQHRRRGLTTSAMRDTIHRSSDDRFAVTLELVQGQAWKDEMPSQTVTEAGATSISFAAFRQSLKSGRS